MLTIAFGITTFTLNAERYVRPEYVRPEVKKIRELQSEIERLNKENAQLKKKKLAFGEEVALEEATEEEKKY